MTANHDYNSLRIWLIKALKPIVDGEPSALAKYVVALIKKDKRNSELRASCQEQLEVFLNDSTTQFVDKLFDVLENKSYIENTEDKQGNQMSATSAHISPNDEYVPEPHNAKPNDELGNNREVNVPDKPKRSAKERLGRHYDDRDGRKQFERNRDGIDKRIRSSRYDNEFRQNRQRRWSPPTKFANRLGRNQYFGRKRSFSPMKERSLSRSPLNTRGRSRSLSQSASNTSSVINSPHRHGPSSGKNSRSSTPRPDVIPFDNKKRNRCRDYDEKGYCVRGDQCPYDHGYDPVVVDDVNLTSVLNYPGRPGLPHPVPPPIIPQSFPHPPPLTHPFGNHSLFNSTHSAFPGKQFIRTQFNENIHNKKQQSNLVNIPTEGKSRGNSNDIFKQSTSLEVRKIPTILNTISKLNYHFSKFGQIKNLQICYDNDPSAAVITFQTREQAEMAYKSPIPVLNNRFIRVFWHNQSVELAGGNGNASKLSIKDRLGTFSADNEELPKVVLPQDNPEKQQMKEIPKENQFKNNTSDDNKNEQNEKVISPPAIMTKRTLIRNLPLKTQHKNQADIIKKSLDFEKKKRFIIESLLKEQKKIMAKIESTSCKNEKKELIKTVKELQITITKMTEEVEKGIDAKKKAAANENKVSKKKRPSPLNIETENNTNTSNGSKKPKLITTPVLSSPSEAKKKLLDTELDLIHVNKSKLVDEKEDGSKIDERHALRIRLAQLKSQAAAMGLVTASVTTRSLDSKTKRVQIKGCHDEEEKQRVLKIIQHCAKVSDIEFGDESQEFIVEFNTRADAVKAIRSASQMLGSSTSITFNWVQLADEAICPPPPVSDKKVSIVKSPTSANVSQEEASILAAHLLQDEDDEDEDRPWRK